MMNQGSMRNAATVPSPNAAAARAPPQHNAKAIAPPTPPALVAASRLERSRDEDVFVTGTTSVSHRAPTI